MTAKAGRKRVLVVQPYGLGDAIVTTQLIKALHATGKWSVFVAASKSRSGWATLASCPGCLGIFDLADDSGIRALRCAVGVSCTSDRRSVRRYGIRGCVVVLPDTQKRVKLGKPKWDRHNVEYMMAAAKALGYDGPPPSPHVPWAPAKIKLSGPVLALGIGYYKPVYEREFRGWSRKHWGAYHKHWGDDNFAEAARLFHGLGGTSILVGDRLDELANGGDIVRKAGGAATSMCGRCGLPGTCGVIRAANAYLGNDTALTQVAHAFHKPSMTIFRVQNLVVRWKPRIPGAEYVLDESGTNGFPVVHRWLESIANQLKGRG